jgi:hypothetical protein
LAAKSTIVFVVLLAVGLGVLWLIMRAKHSIAPLTVAVDYFQVLGRFARLSLPWSSESHSMISQFRLASLDLNAIAPCFLSSSPVLKALLVELAPILNALLLLVFVLVVTRCRGSESSRVLWDRSVGLMLLVLQLMHPTLVVQTLHALYDGFAEGGVSSSESSLRVLGVLGGVFFVPYVVGIAVLFWWCLRRALVFARGADAVLESSSSRDGLSEPLLSLQISQEDREVASRVVGEGLRRVQLRFGCLYSRFRLSRGYWLLVLSVRKVAFAAVFVFLPSQPLVQSVVLLAVLVISLSLQLVFMPYEVPRPMSSSRRVTLWHRLKFDPNIMEASSLSCSIAVLLSGQLFMASSESGVAEKVCLSVLVVSLVYMVGVLVLPMVEACRVLVSFVR